MYDVSAIRFSTEPALLWLAGPVMGVVVAHNLFHRTSTAVVGWGRSWPLIYFSEPALLWPAGKVMGEIGAHEIFHGAKITVVSRRGNVGSGGP